MRVNGHATGASPARMAALTGPTLTPATPAYDLVRINGYLAEAEADNAAWLQWFSTNNIRPLTLTYEDLSRDPGGVAAIVLSHLGLIVTRPLLAANRKMSDQTTVEWAARFRSAQGRRRGPPPAR